MCFTYLPCHFRSQANGLLLCRYLILDVLGRGKFGQVVKGQNTKMHEIVAVEVVKNQPAYFNQSRAEVTILELVRMLISFPVGLLTHIHS